MIAALKFQQIDFSMLSKIYAECGLGIGINYTNNMNIVKRFLPSPLKGMIKSIIKFLVFFFDVGSRSLISNEYNQVTGKMLISIFGSCRQDSIAKHFKVSRVRDGLTYPHYTKEIIQAIKFIKSKGVISPKNYSVFRNIQMGNKIDPIEKLWKQFNKTDLFVVEISSKISYEFDGDYYHHVIIDNTERLETPNDNLNIVKRIQSDDEIREDIQLIKNLLAPKPVIFVTHFCSFETGDRVNLRNLIVREASKIKARVFDPSDLLKNYPITKLTIKEDVINHFSEFAHEVLAGRYQLAILEEIKLYRKEHDLLYLDQVIDSTLIRKKNIGFHGLGDHGFGSVFVYRYAISRGRVPRVNKQKFDAQKYLIDNYPHIPPISYKDVTHVFHNEMTNKKFRSVSNIYTNKKPINKWDNQMRDFFLTNLLSPNKFLEKELGRIKSELNLGVDYSSIHIRFGDDICKYNGLTNTEIENRLLNYLQELTKYYNPKDGYLVLSDSQFFNNSSRDKGFKARQGEVSNRGLGGLEDNHGYLTIIDFMLMIESKSINQISYASRGSRFSELASLVGNSKLDYNLDLSKKLREIM